VKDDDAEEMMQTLLQSVHIAPVKASGKKCSLETDKKALKQFSKSGLYTFNVRYYCSVKMFLKIVENQKDRGVLDYDAYEIVEQLVLFEWSIFKDIGLSELSGLSWTKKKQELAPNVLKIIDVSNYVKSPFH
jgi:hypothetical protein